MATEPIPHPAIHAGEEQWTRDWGQLLRLARQVAGLSLTELSARAGLSKGYLSKLESGHDGARNPSRATLAALARELPSFRPYAHSLEPAAPLGALALADAAPPPLISDTPGERMPLRLGWRDLEVLIAFLALDQSAAAVPLTALTIARATGRATDEITPVLARLVAMDVLRKTSPTRVGGAPTYRRAPALDDVVGLARLGDALVLAAALLVQAPRQSRHTDTSSRTSSR